MTAAHFGERFSVSVSLSHFCHMMASNKAPRLVADPSVGVADLVKVIDDYMVEKGDTNLWKLIQPPSNATWKSAPPVGWLASLSSLFKKYCEVAPNTVVSGKKNKAAIARLCETKGVNHTRKSVDDFADMVDNSIRMGLGHYRTMKQQADLKERAFRRADSTQQAAMENVLSLVNAQAAKDEQGEQQSEQQGEAAETKETKETQETRMCVFEGDEPRPTPAPTASSSKGTTFASDVFDRVLNQAPAQTPRKHNGSEAETLFVDNVPIKIFKRPEKAPAATQDSEDSPIKGPWVLEVDSPDKQLLQNAQDAEPLAKDGKSQQQRLNAVRPKKQKKGKGKGAAASKDDTCPKAMKTSSSKKGNVTGKGKGKGKGSAMKKPAASQPAAASEFADESGTSSYGESYYIIPDQVPDPKTCGLLRVKASHRYVSKSYHDTRKSLEKQGVSADDAKVCASASARKAGQIFDAEWPREQQDVDVQESKKEKSLKGPMKSSNAHEEKVIKNPMKVKKAMKKKKQNSTKTKGKKAIAAEEIPESYHNKTDDNDSLDVW